ncbi:MAG: hypothetical protein ACYTFI_06120 [Planctomycetota bacterium]|jgi:hypothetical protein
MAARATAEEKERDSAKEILDRAEREIRHLTQLGVDVVALNDRFNSAKSQFSDNNWNDVERDCGEILVLAKSMQAITSASLKAGGRGKGKDKMSETARMEMSRLIAAEVGNRVEAVARTLPTASTIEETVQNKIQEALVTGGLIERLEAVATEKAQSAVAGIPRFTAKDAQAAANLVVQRALTQFLSSKELGARVGKAVEAEVTKALKAAEKRIAKESEALVNTRVASLTSKLPTKEGVAEDIEAALGAFLKDAPLEERVLGLAAERAKAEVDRAPDLMSEAATKIARQEADALFKTHLRSKEFVDQVKQASRESANEIVETMPKLTQEDVEVISRRVGEESLGQLADSDVLREKIESMAKDVVEKSLSEAGLDKKIADAITQNRLELMTNKDFADWIKDGTLEVVKEAGLGDTSGLEKKLMTKEKVEKIARHEAATAAMDLLEKKEFARSIADVLELKPIRKKLAEIAGDSVSADDVSKTVTKEAKGVFTELLDDPKFAKKLKAAAGGGDEVKEATKKLVDRVKKIENALPALVKKMLKDTLGETPSGPSSKDIEEAVENAVASKIDAKALQAQVTQIAANSVKDISNSADFKAMLDGKFKVMTNYITKELLPKQIKRIMGGG